MKMFNKGLGALVMGLLATEGFGSVLAPRHVSISKAKSGFSLPGRQNSEPLCLHERSDKGICLSNNYFIMEVSMSDEYDIVEDEMEGNTEPQQKKTSLVLSSPVIGEPGMEIETRQDKLWDDLGEQNVSALEALGDLSNERGIAPETFIQAFDKADNVINLLLSKEEYKDLITSQKMISTLVSFYHPLLHRDLAKAYSSFDKHTEAVLKNFLELTCRTLEDLGENEVSDEVRECLCDKPLRGLDGCRSLFNWISRRAEKHLH